MAEQDAPIDGTYPKLGRKVREVLRWGDPKSRFSVRVAARKTRISHATIANMARGDRPSMGLIIQFAQGMGVDINELLESADYAPIQQGKPSSSQEKVLIHELMEISRFKLDDHYNNLVKPKDAGYKEALRTWHRFGLPGLPSFLWITGVNETRSSQLLKGYADALLTEDEIVRELDDKYKTLFQICLDYGYAYNNLMKHDYTPAQAKIEKTDDVQYIQHLFRELNGMQAECATLLLGWGEAFCQDRYQYPPLEELIGLLIADQDSFDKQVEEISKKGQLSQLEKESRKAAFEIWRANLAPTRLSEEITCGNPFFDTHDHCAALTQLAKSLEHPNSEDSSLALVYLGAYAMIFAFDYEKKLSTGPRQLEFAYLSLSRVIHALETWYEHTSKKSAEALAFEF